MSQIRFRLFRSSDAVIALMRNLSLYVVFQPPLNHIEVVHQRKTAAALSFWTLISRDHPARFQRLQTLGRLRPLPPVYVVMLIN